MGKWEPPFVPKSGSTLKVLAVCRISTLQQDPKSLADQEANYRRWLTEHVDIPWTCEVIASQGSGENLERAEYLDLIERTPEQDVVLTEDLGRICRRIHAHIFCENAVDVQTRVIAINDHVDTAKEGWEMSSYFAVMRHETYNKDTSKRIQRSLRNRFNQGGVVQCFQYGYVKPHPKATDSECYKDPEAEAVYKEWFERLDSGQTYADVSDWLDEKGIPVGPYARSDGWTPELVAKDTHNPILKGVRRRNVRMSSRVNQSGRRKSIKAPPSELLTRYCPHLAFFESSYYDGIIAKLAIRNGKYRRGKDGRDARRGVPRKRTRWPGQHLRCGVCGRQYVFGGHGQTDHLMCDGARHHKCWNGITANAPLTVDQVLFAVRTQIEQLDGFDDAFREMILEEARAGQKGIVDEIKKMERQQQSLIRSISNYTDAIGKLGASDALLNSLHEAETQLADIKHRLQHQRRRQSEQLPSLPSSEELKEIADQAFRDIDTSSPAFARLMHELISDIHVFPYRLIDGGLPVLKAKFTFNLLGFIPSPSRLPGHYASLQRVIVVDLFNKPQRELFRPDVVEWMKLLGDKPTAIAAEIGTNSTVVQRAMQIQRLMDSAGVNDAYLPIRVPIDGNRKYSRHRHPRFKFEPLPGYEQPGFPDGLFR